MPSSSPFLANDYTNLNTYKPFQLPINEIAKATMANNQYWMEGAQKVKAYYDNALGLELTTDQNNERKAKFIKDADQQLTKLSSMDLRDPSVQRQGLSIYTPIFNDKAIQYDNATTKLKSSIISQAEGYKNKKLSDKGFTGEGYNVTNLQDALDGFEKLNKNTPADEKTLESIYNSVAGKNYTPYYDYHKDVNEIVNKCKGAATTSVDAQSKPGWVVSSAVSGASGDNLAVCLKNNLNGNAWQQIAIEGRRSFKNADNSINTQAMRDAFNQDYRANLDNKESQRGSLIARKAAYEKIFSQTQDERAKKAAELADKDILDLEGEIGNYMQTFDKFRDNDVDYITKNYNQLSNSLYSNKLIGGLSAGYANQGIKTTMVRDPDYIMREKLGLEHNYREQELAEKYKQEAKLKGINLDQQGNPIYTPLDLNLEETNVVNTGIDDFVKQVDENTTSKIVLAEEFYNGQVAKEWEAASGTKYGFFNASNKPQTLLGKVYQPGQITAEGAAYLQKLSASGNKEARQFLNNYSLLQNQAKINAATAYAVENDKDVISLSASWRKQLESKDKFPDITTANGIPVSAIDIQNAIEGKPGRVQIIQTSNNSKNVFGGLGVRNQFDTPTTKYIVDGNVIEGSLSKPETGFFSLLEKVKAGNTENNSKIKEKKNELYGKALLEQQGRIYREDLNLDEKNPYRQRILDVFPSTVEGADKLTIGDVKIKSTSPSDGVTSFEISLGKTGSKIPDATTLLGKLPRGSEISKVHTSSNPNTIIVDVPIPELVDARYKNNPNTTLQKSLNQLESVLKNANTEFKAGKELEEYAIEINSDSKDNVDFKIIPVKTYSKNVLWNIQIKNDKGIYVPRSFNQTKEELISFLGQNK